MQILGLEKMSLVDFDGLVAATVFTGGCNFLCPFCHNSPLVLDYKALPTIPEEEVLSYLAKRKGIVDGVCVSGGEPTLYHDLPKFLEKIKNIGLDIKLDTNGTNPEMIKTLKSNALVDYFAMDIKNDRENYGKIIGIDGYDTKKIEKSVDFLISTNQNYEFRTTLIKEFHSIDNMLKIGNWIKGAIKYRLQQFKETEGCIDKGLSAIDENTAKTFVNALKEFVPNTELRGY
jgi:pyruvate formate lyase activating enzyme